MIIPAPIPVRQLTRIRSHIWLMKRQAKPLRKKTVSPTTSSLNLFPVTDKRPASSIKGIINTEGNEVSICISRSVACGKTLFKSPRIGRWQVRAAKRRPIPTRPPTRSSMEWFLYRFVLSYLQTLKILPQRGTTVIPKKSPERKLRRK